MDIVDHTLPKQVGGAVICQSGKWLLATMPMYGKFPKFSLYPKFANLCNQQLTTLVVALPLTLPNKGEWNGRVADRIARKLIGRRYNITPPWRCVLEMSDYQQIRRYYRSCEGSPSASKAIPLTRRAFKLIPHIREAQKHVDARQKDTIKEGHPELSFMAMNDSNTLVYPPDCNEGRTERSEILNKHGLPKEFLLRRYFSIKVVGEHDLQAACALCWSSVRIWTQCSQRIPDRPRLDHRGIEQAIYF